MIKRASPGRQPKSSYALVGLVMACCVMVGCSATPPTDETTRSPVASLTQESTPTDVSVATGVDGDTIKVNGQSVRIVGVDTPERGECGYQEATSRTNQLISDGVVLVQVPGVDERDVYDRLLRYVTTAEGEDVGTVLLEEGLAHARYDSSDGYPKHPNETLYRSLDTEHAHMCSGQQNSSGTTPTPVPSNQPTGNCDPNYGGTCVPISSSDLDCGHIDGPVTILSSDPHGFDLDGDGRGCESR